MSKDSPEELYPEERVTGACGLFAYTTEIWIEGRKGCFFKFKDEAQQQ